jgi:IstB-like ATP binding protein
LGSERFTEGTLDRLTHRCRIIETKGESYRLQDANAPASRRAHPITKPIDETSTPS